MGLVVDVVDNQSGSVGVMGCFVVVSGSVICHDGDVSVQPAGPPEISLSMAEDDSGWFCG